MGGWCWYVECGGGLFWRAALGPAREKNLGAVVGGGGGEIWGWKRAGLPPISVLDAVFLVLWVLILGDVPQILGTGYIKKHSWYLFALSHRLIVYCWCMPPLPCFLGNRIFLLARV